MNCHILFRAWRKSATTPSKYIIIQGLWDQIYRYTGAVGSYLSFFGLPQPPEPVHPLPWEDGINVPILCWHSKKHQSIEQLVISLSSKSVEWLIVWFITWYWFTFLFRTPVILIPLLTESFPFYLSANYILECYISNLFMVTSYLPKHRPQVVLLVLSEITKMDVSRLHLYCNVNLEWVLCGNDDTLHYVHICVRHVHCKNERILSSHMMRIIASHG